jgi:hypothetical protein
MKLSKTQIKQLIKEELEAVMSEMEAEDEQVMKEEAEASAMEDIMAQMQISQSTGKKIPDEVLQQIDAQKRK